MFDGWNHVSLGDAAYVLAGFAFKSKQYTECPDDHRLLRGDNIAQGTIRWDNAKRWKFDPTDERLRAYVLEVGDIVLAMDRPWIEAGLKFGQIRSDDVHALLVQRVARLRAREGFDQGFLAAIIGSARFTSYTRSITTGTAVPHISVGQIESYAFPCPPLAEQRAIAEILGALDDKIELNRKMNTTLDELARTIFRSWFVDFDPVRAKAEGREPFGMDAQSAALFPDRFTDSKLGRIPEGWMAKPLDEIADFLNGLALQKHPPLNDGADLPVIKIAQLKKNSTEGAGKAGASVPDKYVVTDGDILFSWSGSLEAIVWGGGKGALNQHLFKVTSQVYPKWFYFHAVLQHLDGFRSIAADKATTMGHIQRRHLSEALVAVPRDALLRAASQVFEPMLDLISNNLVESRTLADLRDTMLPELISGRFRVPDAGKAVAEVV